MQAYIIVLTFMYTCVYPLMDMDICLVNTLLIHDTLILAGSE